jgi:hypothetical protein
VCAGKADHGADGALPAHAPDQDFGDQNGQRDSERRHHIDNDEGRAAILARNEGKAPDIAKAHGAADGRHQKRKARRPMFMRKGCHKSPTLKSFCHWPLCAEPPHP